MGRRGQVINYSKAEARRERKTATIICVHCGEEFRSMDATREACDTCEKLWESDDGINTTGARTGS